ncbi:DUF885 domain-containing protein [Sphingomonas sp. C3-2]|uniref:DUF885 domain-containing protein n=1 Tax=Sphingomonas sp. C3-2 TaxID=3062169 RepID=UPI002B2D23C1|nr:DUF885 family protein [Sphingomonas sp. C3-2]
MPAASIASTANQQLKALYEADWAWRMAETGMIEGEEGELLPGNRLPRVDVASQLRRLDHDRKTLIALDAIPAAQLSDEERINAEVLRTNLQTAIDDGAFREWEMPFNSDSSFWTYLDSPRGFRTADDYRRYIARMRDVPRFFAENIVNMRAGLARGFSVPQATLVGREKSLLPFTSQDLAANPFYIAFGDMPATIPAAEQQALRNEGEKAIREAVAPAYAELLIFLRDEYLPRARKTLAATAMPNGKAYYAAQIREYATLDLTPEQIHEKGLAEVARIEAEMRKTMVDSGFKGDFAAYLHFLRTDPQFYAKTPEELLMTSAWVAKRVDAKIGQVIGFLPRRRFTILPVPDAIAPFYTAGRGGLESCLMNTYDLPSRPLYNIPALTLHECSPGHSLQAALAEEQKEKAAFRRNTYFSGYGEGWGLYTEWLGEGMGIYRTPYERFGRLSYEMWRAARLVIDTGIHRYGWSRDKAIAYLANHTALSEHEVATEVDRYISWPGQAVAYKLGEMTIRRLRGEAEAALGRDFDQRRFHDTILALGSVPLSTLERRLNEFVDEEKHRLTK